MLARGNRYWICVTHHSGDVTGVRTVPARTIFEMPRPGWSIEGAVRQHIFPTNLDPVGIAPSGEVMSAPAVYSGHAMAMTVSGSVRTLPAGSEAAGTGLPTPTDTTGIVSVGATLYGMLTEAHDDPTIDADI